MVHMWICRSGFELRALLGKLTGLEWEISQEAAPVPTFVFIPPYDFLLFREQARAPGAQQHHGPGAAAHPQQPPGFGADSQGGGAALGPGQCHHLQRLCGLGPPRLGQGEVAPWSGSYRTSLANNG